MITTLDKNRKIQMPQGYCFPVVFHNLPTDQMIDFDNVSVQHKISNKFSNIVTFSRGLIILISALLDYTIEHFQLYFDCLYIVYYIIHL